MTAYALRLANGVDTAARVRFGDALGLTPGSVPMSARSGLRPDGGGAVTVVAGTMNVSVAPFSGWIDGTTSDAQAGYPVFSDAAVVLTLAAGHATLARVDTIVVQVRDTAFDGSGSTDARVLVVQGTPGAGAPTLPASCTPLRDVNVPANLSAGTGGLASGNLGADRRQYVTGLGGILPVASATERDALIARAGLAVYRLDTKKVEVHDGTAWKTYAPESDTGWLPLTTVLAGSTADYRVRNGVASVRLFGTATVGTGYVSVVAVGGVPASACPSSNIWGGALCGTFVGGMTVGADGSVLIRQESGGAKTGGLGGVLTYPVG